MGRRRQHNPRYKLMLKRLRRARRGAGLTQADVARALGETQGYVSKSESGERRMDAVELRDFAGIYGAPVETLLPAPKVRRPPPGGARRDRVAEPPVRPRRGGKPGPGAGGRPGKAGKPGKPRKPGPDRGRRSKPE